MTRKHSLLKRSCVFALAIAGAVPAMADATLTIVPTSSNLAATNSVQQIQFVVATSDGSPLQIDGELLNFQINNGSTGPTITAYDIFGGTIFGSSNNGPYYAIGDSIVNSGHLAIQATDSIPATVNANGLVATLSLIAGLTPGTFEIKMLNTLNENSFITSDGSLVPILFPHGMFSIGNTDRHWNKDSGGHWDDNLNWNPFAPYATGDEANFLGAVTAGTGSATVTLDGNRTVGSVTFSNTAASYSIAQGAGTTSTLQLNNGLATPTITNLGGNHSITAPIYLASNTNISIANSSVLTLAGPVSGVSSNLSLLGSGTLVLTGANSYAATTIASGSTLRVGNGFTTGTLGTGAVSNSGTLVIDRSGAVTFANAISGTGGVSLFGSATVTFNGISNYSGLTLISNGTLRLNGSVSHTIGSVSGGGALQIDTGSTAMTKDFNIASLSLLGTADLAIAPSSSYSKIFTLSIDHGGSGSSAIYTSLLNLNNNRLILEAGSSADKSNKILSLNESIFAGHGGTNNIYTGSKGITSNTVAADATHLTIGVYDNAVLKNLANSALPRTDWGGGIGNVDGNSILVTPALKGDANLDGLIDIGDMVVIANNWNSTGKINGISTIDMAHGDVNADGVVDIGDMVVIANNWNQVSSFNLAASMVADGSAPRLVGLAPAQVPEPASLALLAIGGAGLLIRRRRSA